MTLHYLWHQVAKYRPTGVAIMALSGSVRPGKPRRVPAPTAGGSGISGMSRVRFALAVLVIACLAPSGASAQVIGGSAALTIAPGAGPLGSTFHVHGTQFVNFSLITNQMDVTVFDVNNNIVEGGSVAADADGNIDADIDTGDAKYAPGTYSVLASYTYWGVRRNPLTNAIICDFCPIRTVPLADPVTFTVGP